MVKKRRYKSKYNNVKKLILKILKKSDGLTFYDIWEKVRKKKNIDINAVRSSIISLKNSGKIKVENPYYPYGNLLVYKVNK
jgi:DNA-directed RNA polymerase delta subunit